MQKEADKIEGNFTTTALAADATWTGEWIDVSHFTMITMSCKSDTDGTVYMDFTIDPENGEIESALDFKVFAGVNKVHSLKRTRQYYRTRFVNGSTEQTSFNISTFGDSSGVIVVPKNLALAQDADAIAVRGTSFDQEVAEGIRSGYQIINKFGRNPDIDNATTPEDVWSNGGLFTGFDITNLSGAQTVDITSDSANDTAAGSGARTIRVEGLGATGVFQTADYTLNGLAGTTTTETWYRIFRAYVLTSGSSNQAFNAGNITFTTSTSAIVIAHLGAGTSQSQLALYTIPSSRKGYIKNIYVEVSRSISSSVEGSVYVRPYGASPRLTRQFSASDTSSFNKDIYGAIRYEGLTDIAIRISSVSANNTAITAAFDILLVDD